MLLFVVLPLSLFSLFVRCAPAPGFDALQTTGFARDANILSQITPIDTSQSPSSIGALYSRPQAKAMSDSPADPLVRVNHGPPTPIYTPSFQVMNDSTPKPLVMAYYPDWAGPDFPPEKINFTLFDWIDFAFALPTQDFDLIWDSDEAPMLLQRLVHAGHSAGTKIKLSIGGWTGSRYVSQFINEIVSSSEPQIFLSGGCYECEQRNVFKEYFSSLQ
jgi:hypothetical protein